LDAGNGILQRTKIKPNRIGCMQIGEGLVISGWAEIFVNI
jgi:hypothetical protein